MEQILFKISKNGTNFVQNWQKWNKCYSKLAKMDEILFKIGKKKLNQFALQLVKMVAVFSTFNFSN